MMAESESESDSDGLTLFAVGRGQPHPGGDPVPRPVTARNPSSNERSVPSLYERQLILATRNVSNQLVLS
eukprot:762639-Hanusia_phi.AAC.10